ncbi:MAG: zf-TFIIB domain-containing protein [Armatimonadetes bacterium]|nr:zf-TFIIB domain-containing protein [Armatimonadota bacterium]
MSGHTLASPLQRRRQCPACQWEMLPDGRLGVEVDYCPLCRGVWLDGGELEAIVARTVVAAEQSQGDRR